MSELRFTVLGVAQPQGSMKAFARMGKDQHGDPKPFAAVTGDNPKNINWRQSIAWTAAGELHKQKFVIVTGPVSVDVAFYLPRPKDIKAKIVPHLKKPDLDKLVRSVVDALTAIVWADDSQLTRLVATKAYAAPGEQPRVEIWVREVTDGERLHAPDAAIADRSGGHGPVQGERDGALPLGLRD